ncbi:hypothetical protein LQ327_17455 [Actinomycetospora endophytica]|uniref:Uncharacterized protein n=1 Tax=Actinomycetospora endophytica TaxID=2291215 RepID=A0ABS8PB56_9PSEU|nr:hypothetical protein [Actinomycetospora endophytica]MCD2195157.1 hypothetical protein [Actinomycetospora endophytica]
MNRASASDLGCDAVGSGRRRHAASADRSNGRRFRLLAVVLAAALAALGLGSGAAWADGSDPTLVSTLTGVEPALPPGVLVQVQTSVAPQMVVANPTPVPLTLLDPTGVPFAQVSSAGVQGNVNSPFFHVSLNPPDAPPAQLPPGAAQNAPVRWVPVSASPEWGWFDPRLQPDVNSGAGPGGQDSAQDPSDPTQQRITVLAHWRIGMTYGATPVAAVGELERRPVVGRFDTTVDPVATPGLTATVAAGTVPAMFLQVPDGHTVEVLGRNGQPWLRAGPTGTDADTGSAEYLADRAGRGEDGPVGVGWTHLSDDGSSLTWLDRRLGWSNTVPPPAALAASGPTELARWTVPLRVDGAPAQLTGAVRWMPTKAVLAQQGQDDPWASRPWVTISLICGGVLLAGALLLLLRRARSSTHGPDEQPPAATTASDADPAPSDSPTPSPILEDHR